MVILMTSKHEGRRVEDYEEIRPLVDLCKAGKLFDVQAWIAAGKPVNAPPIPTKGRRHKTPLETAIESGFHSLVQILLEAGAVQEPTNWNSPMDRALEMRRFDLVQLLVDHGFDAKSIDMKSVFETWDPQIMEYFIQRGAEIQIGNPFACAFSQRIRTALRVFKECRERSPSIQEQANIALRYHCKEGNMKWVSLMLWAGADPLKRGSENYADEQDDENEECGLSALGFAALYNHFEVFSLKSVRLNPAEKAVQELVSYLCDGEGHAILVKLLEKGLNPNDQENGGCSAIPRCIQRMTWDFRSRVYGFERNRKFIDTEDARDNLKAIHLLAKHGARWHPKEPSELNDTRRSFLKMEPDYTVEFVWIMSKYKACEFAFAQDLVRTPAIKGHLRAHQGRISELLAKWIASTDRLPVKST
jgi:hypothetical protein